MNTSTSAFVEAAPSVQKRVKRLLAAMTLEEKIAQLTQYFYFQLPPHAEPALDFDADEQPLMVEEAIRSGSVGSLLFVSRASEINRLQRMVIEGNRLGIPALFGFDVIHGLRTILPVPIALAASWDPVQVEAAQRVAAREARAVGINWTFAPMIDIARDPRWGRMIEGAGEDPFLGSAMAAAQVRGFQGQALDSADSVLSGPKHFVGYGAAVGGRDYDEVDLSESSLWNTYFPPFKAAVDAGAANIMTAYMTLNGIPAAGSPWLFDDVLRKTWGFEGFVVSDANVVKNLVTHGFAADAPDAAERALRAGVDMEMAITDPAYSHLADRAAAEPELVRLIDESVSRVLTAKALSGVLDAPFVDEDNARRVLADPEHRRVAQRAAERSAVLLRNEGELLPLDADSLTSVAVIGPLADSARDTIGPWVFDYDLDETVTILEGIRKRVGDTAAVHYAPGIPVVQRAHASMFDQFGRNRPSDADGFDPDAAFADAIASAQDADVAIVVIGEWQNMVGEAASRSSLELPGEQLKLLQAVVATGTPTVALVMNGRPLDLRWAADHVPAILDIWYPGTRGGDAAAALLFGDVSPGGKLPFSWPRSVGQVPMTYSHTRSHEPQNQWRRYWDETNTPLFPFGFGLTYGPVEYSEIELDRTSVGLDETVTATIRITNQGARPVEEVVQLYLHQQYGAAARPVRELKGFHRVSLEVGETQEITFALDAESRTYWSSATRGWVRDVSRFDVWIGGSSSAETHAAFETHP
ncbi:glycoside hydrolase family 3 N-terminal domain-containing protein [Arthrobacter sp. KNU-44]|uniref:glycoside hydrolase family 3 N-terminal domain-containing protein n=1 Tax=Arthrobacter sp. KNU-44 TaxID=3450744 RepID=UPI003F424477